MSQNKVPVNLPSVEKLMQRLAAAERSQQKEIRISIEEARQLAMELSIMTSKMGQTMLEIHSMLGEIRASTTQIDVKVDGGGFGSA